MEARRTGLFQGYSPSDKDRDVAADFEKKYGYAPKEIFTHGAAKLAGPIIDTEGDDGHG